MREYHAPYRRRADHLIAPAWVSCLDDGYALVKDHWECLLMFFLHQLLRLFDDAKMPCFTFIITCSHHFRRKSINYILIIIKLRGQSPHFEELSPSCFYFERSPSRFRQSVIAPLRHLTNAAETPLQSSRGCEEVSLSPMPSSRPICQTRLKLHESLRLCHRCAARFVAPA